MIELDSLTQADEVHLVERHGLCGPEFKGLVLKPRHHWLRLSISSTLTYYDGLRGAPAIALQGYLMGGGIMRLKGHFPDVGDERVFAYWYTGTQRVRNSHKRKRPVVRVSGQRRALVAG